MSDLIKLCGLEKVVKDNQTYLTGILGSSRVLILRNRYKKTETDPDYNLFVTTERKARKVKDKPVDDEEVPF